MSDLHQFTLRRNLSFLSCCVKSCLIFWLLFVLISDQLHGAEVMELLSWQGFKNRVEDGSAEFRGLHGVSKKMDWFHWFHWFQSLPVLHSSSLVPFSFFFVQIFCLILPFLFLCRTCGRWFSRWISMRMAPWLLGDRQIRQIALSGFGFAYPAEIPMVIDMLWL